MTRTLLSVFACSALLIAAPGQAPDATSPSPVDADARAFVAVHGDVGETGPIVLSAQALAQTTGTGFGSDFWCGAIAGAGLAVSMSVVGTPIGAGLAAAGVACAMFF